MSERENWEETIVRPPLKITGKMKCMEAKAFDKLTAENAALRAQVERLEGEKLRLREVVKESHEEFSMVQIHGKKWPVRGTMRKLAAVLRETDVDTETGRE